MRILDGGADLGKEAVHRGCEFRHGTLDRWRRRRDEVAVLYCKKPLAQRRERPCTFAVWSLGRDVAHKKTEGAGHQRGDDFLVDLRQIDERAQRKEKRSNARGA
jgi:hypothetical protein